MIDLRKKNEKNLEPEIRCPNFFGYDHRNNHSTIITIPFIQGCPEGGSPAPPAQSSKIWDFWSIIFEKIL